MINAEGFFTPMGLRTLIMNAVGTKLGVYVLPGATTFVPAIAVLPDKTHGNNYPPPETTISGIEVVIRKPNPNSIARLGNDRLRVNKWEIYINQWDGNGNLIEVVDILINKFQDNSIPFTSPVFPEHNLDIGIVPYCRISIKEQYLRNPDYV